jgi:hypothetical protein
LHCPDDESNHDNETRRCRHGERAVNPIKEVLVAIARATNSFLARVKQDLDHVSRIADPDIREGYVGTLRKTADVLESHAVQESAIAVDTNLSQKGQEARLTELTKDTLKKLRFLPERATEADAAYARLEAILFAVPDAPKGSNEVVQFLRESEIRSWLRSLSPAERMKTYLLAVQHDDVEMVRAVRLAPGGPLIPEDIRGRGDRERIETAKPKEFSRLQSLSGLRDQLHGLSNHLQRWLGGYGVNVEFPTPSIRSGQHLVGYGHEVKFPMPNPKPENFK